MGNDLIHHEDTKGTKKSVMGLAHESGLDCGYRLDIVADNELVIEIKAVERLMPIHDAQMLTYLRLGGFRAGLLMNFNRVMLKDGLRRVVL